MWSFVFIVKLMFTAASQVSIVHCLRDVPNQLINQIKIETTPLNLEARGRSPPPLHIRSLASFARLQACGCASRHFFQRTWQLPIKLDKDACLQRRSIICLTHETGKAINKTAYVCSARRGISAAGVSTLAGV